MMTFQVQASMINLRSEAMYENLFFSVVTWKLSPPLDKPAIEWWDFQLPDEV